MRFLWLFSFVALLFVACGGEETSGSECMTKEDCTVPQICVEGMCVNPDDTGSGACKTNQDCAFGFTCVDLKCVQSSGDTAGDTSADSAGDTASDTGNSADSTQDDVADSGDSVQDSADTTPDNSVQPDNSVTPDEDGDETPDEDVDAGDIACVNTGACPEELVCIGSLCRDPFSARWRIGDISLTVSNNGDDWDPFSNDPDPFVHLYMNGHELFETSVADDTYTASYPDHYDTYLLPTDKLQFIIIDKDTGVDTNGDDEIADITLDHIDPIWLHKGSYAVPPEDQIDKLTIHFDMLN